jgi:hypothetical protein
MDRGPLSWASTTGELSEREQHAAELVGSRIIAVRYFEIDYRRLQEAAEDEVVRGSRLVTDDAEWSKPTWRWRDFDAIDYGVEMDTSLGETYCAVWEQAGPNEGLALRQEPLRLRRLVSDGAFAIWDVAEKSRWTPLIGRRVTAVELSWHRPEPSADLCCDAVTLRFDAEALHLTLGDANAQGELVGSADNVAVLSDESARRYRVGPYGPPSDAV